ncbi:MAG TPA: hypothetical protein VGY96_09850 [Streptosporangiaceae bacterium]|nr:hypothetical protein [Streptosporangiaceae bacterium]
MAEVMPGESHAPTGAQAAAAYMRELLLRPGRYRRKWEQYAERSRQGQVNQLAVAEVLAHYLWEHPRAQGDLDVLPRQLKDTASRALSGKLLSKATLALFSDAFGLGPLEREHLLKLWEGSAHVRVLSGPRAISDEKAGMLGSPRTKTLSLHDHHYLGPDGLPAKHRVIHVVEAIVDGVDRIPYRADTNATTVEVGQGFSGLAGPVYQIAGLFVVDMLLAKPLAIGETATLEYTTSFHYSTPPAQEFRRIVQIHVENLDIRVEFHPDKLPSGVVWAVWDGMDGPIVERQPVTLDSQFAVHRYLRLAEKTTVGFHWDW